MSSQQVQDANGRAPVSVIIPAYKAARTIRRALDSVLGQSAPPRQILVIDDGSPDDLASCLEPYRGKIEFHQKPNGGAASARNFGIEKATAEFVAFLDADDFWEPEKLERQLRVMRDHSDVGMVAGWFYEQAPGQARIDPPLDRGRFGRVWSTRGDEVFQLATQVWTGTVLVRRDFLGDHRFESGLEPAEDRDLWIRLIAAGGVYLIPQALATAVLEPDSLSRSSMDVDCRNMLRVIERNAHHLTTKSRRLWQALTYRRWAANDLVRGLPVSALGHAVRRLRLQPFSAEAWWVSAKCAVHACGRPLRNGRGGHEALSPGDGKALK
jgi:glycosyltransferase involved in cell wall biosynthesis